MADDNCGSCGYNYGDPRHEPCNDWKKSADKAVQVSHLQAARDFLADYHEKHRIGVKEVIHSEWARGHFDGRKESLNILDAEIKRLVGL